MKRAQLTERKLARLLREAWGVGIALPAPFAWSRFPAPRPQKGGTLSGHVHIVESEFGSIGKR